MPTYQVHIKSNGRIADKHCRKTISKSSGDRVRFMAVGEGTWTIHFLDGSPFTKTTFEGISAGSSVDSGPPTGKTGTTYKYEVRNAKGKVTDDPDILVDF
jgi:hypothetical protein